MKTARGWEGDPAEARLLATFEPRLIKQCFGQKTSIRVYRGRGCGACHDTGYQGRLGIFELLEMSPKLAQLIAEKADTDKMLAQAIKDGMVTMSEDGLNKVVEGRTTLSEVLRVTKGLHETGKN